MVGVCNFTKFHPEKVINLTVFETSHIFVHYLKRGTFEAGELDLLKESTHCIFKLMILQFVSSC